VSAIEQHGEKALEHTGSEGQQQLRQQMKTASDDWKEAIDSLSELLAVLESRLQAWTKLDKCCEELSSWLSETEVQLENIEMKSAVADKQAVVTQLSVSFLACFLTFNYCEIEASVLVKCGMVVIDRLLVLTRDHSTFM